jgi:hypothetical protein
MEGIMNNREKKPKKDDKCNDARLDPENCESEINPEKLEREGIHPDEAGEENSKGHQPYEF